MKHETCLLVLAVLGRLLAVARTLAFQAPSAPLPVHRVKPRTTSALHAVAVASEEGTAEKKRALLAAAAGTQNGISATAAQAEAIEALARDLEARNDTNEPARSALNAGSWRVRYSTAPPPSNGQLGPFQGAAIQTIDLDLGLYANELLVGGSEASPWLSATLVADWDDLEDGSSWKVNNHSVCFFGLVLRRRLCVEH